ncbi:MAG TPA: GNAT family N-acetyltransferase [Thermotogota bacterium]|nr:GNAT family N-acetyltransferase [Thermotogota bacterium]
MEYKSLASSTTEQVWSAFNDAFSDYEVPIQMPLEKFISVGKRRGADYNISLGAYDDTRLSGFVVNAGGDWQGKKTIYDCFTGVVKDYQRKGIATQMLEASCARSKTLGFENYLLEVIQSNTKAYELYLSKGFEVVRSFDVYRCEVEKLVLSDKAEKSFKIRKMDNADWETFRTFRDITPSWQNSDDSVQRTQADFEIFCAFDKAECIGYLILESETGDIPQIAIHKDYRRKGIASALIKTAAESRKAGYRLSFLNIDSAYVPYGDFLKNIGAGLVVRQYEMIRTL